jgi:hypothetical protein
VLSSHYHLLLRVENAQQLSQFMGYFNGNLAREVARLTGWKDKVWSRRYESILVTEEDTAQVDRLRYLLENSCKEGLVDSPIHWPGVHCAKALITVRALLLIVLALAACTRSVPPSAAPPPLEDVEAVSLLGRPLVAPDLPDKTSSRSSNHQKDSRPIGRSPRSSPWPLDAPVPRGLTGSFLSEGFNTLLEPDAGAVPRGLTGSFLSEGFNTLLEPNAAAAAAAAEPNALIASDWGRGGR